MITRLKWPLVGIGVVAILAAPNTTAEAVFGPWHFTVTAVGNREFREVYAFQSRLVCEDQRRIMQQGVAQVVEGGDTTFRGLARRLRLSPCEITRRAR